MVKRFRKIVFRAEAGRVGLAACCGHAASMAGVGAFGVRGRVRGGVRPQVDSPADVLGGMGCFCV